MTNSQQCKQFGKKVQVRKRHALKNNSQRVSIEQKKVRNNNIVDETAVDDLLVPDTRMLLLLDEEKKKNEQSDMHLQVVLRPDMNLDTNPPPT